MQASPAAIALASSMLMSSATSAHAQVDRNREIAQRWMEMVLGEKFARDFPMVLLSGEWLCALVNRVFVALGMRDRRCKVIKTTWPAATAESDELTTRDSSTEAWQQQKRYARQNVEEYLRACVAIGVAPHDCFLPDDLLELHHLDKVYRNILALQSVSVTISHRRSIDERSGTLISPTGAYAGSDRSRESIVSSVPNVVEPLNENMSWEELLTQYEELQRANAQADGSTDDAASVEGLGKLAHQIWCLEELIRSRLFRDDDEGDQVVPDVLHGKLWLLASGALTDMRRRTELYQQHQAMDLESTEATRQIDADLHRTVLDDDKHEWTDDQTQMMRRVLVAYSYYNPTLGYCQGLNYIVARLLQYVGEEEAFFLLIKMIELVPDDYYTTMLGLAVDQHVFADFVRLQIPEISEHLNELGGSGMELSLACTEWFLTLFASPCKKEVTVRIWDTIFLMGDEVLFRVALALMQLEKPVLTKCNTYGDMLKRLNEIGRGEVNPVQLMKDSRQQESVIRARIEDFRAHHRLQLATGIVSSIDVDDSNASTGDTSRDLKEDAKIKLFGPKKKPGLFKHNDKSAGRHYRSFDRILTEEYTVSLQKEHPTFSCFYDGRPPFMVEEYWGSEESYNQWGKRNHRRINEVDSPRENKEERRRLQSENIGKISEDISIGGKPKSRERRSKSTAYISQPKRTSQSMQQQFQHGKKMIDEEVHFGRSPRGWLQRFEVWQKDMKIQKEKKKAEKMKMKEKLSLGDTESENTPRRAHRGQNKTFATVPKHYRNDGEYFSSSQRSSNSVDSSMSLSGGLRFPPDRRPEPLSRSQSESYLSPNDHHYARASWQDALRQSEEMDSQIIMRSSQEPESSDFSVSKARSRSRSGSNHKDRRDHKDQSEPRSGSSRKTISIRSDAVSSDYNKKHRPHSQENLFSGYSQSVPSLSASVDDMRRLSYDLGKPPVPVINDLTSGAPIVRRSSTRGYRRQSDEFDDDDTRALLNSLAPPPMRRNVSVPVGEHPHHGHHHHHHHPPHHHHYYAHHTPMHPNTTRHTPVRKITSDTASVIRERAQVLSYLQRKASDASSLAGSFPRSPRGDRDRSDAGRLSGSSSDSVRLSELLHAGSRSVKSTGTRGAVRKSSFSFFDKLSLDMESHLDDLRESFTEHKEPDPLLGSSTWSPGSAREHLTALSAAASAAAFLSPTSSSYYSNI